MKTRDRLGRRLFSSHTRHLNRDFQADARQIRWMQFLNLHGFASSNYLHQYTAATHKCRQTSARMLRQLFDGGLIYRPERQRETEGADGQHHVYALTERGAQFLKREGLWQNAIRPTGPWVHQYMIACITASIHIMCDQAGRRFIPGHEISSNLAVDIPFSWGNGRHSCQLIPDSLFAIQYEKGFIAYLVEADRNTEPNDPKTPHRKSARRMVKQYGEFIGTKRYRQDYGLNCPLIVLNVSVSEDHVSRVMRIVDEEIGACRYFAFAAAPEFRTPFRVPRSILANLASAQRTGFDPFSIIQ